MERVAVSTTCLWRIWAIFTSIRYDCKWAKAGPRRKLCQVAKAVLKPIEQAMQPWIGGPRRTRRTRRTWRTRTPPDYARFCSMHFSLLRCLGSAQQDTSGMWWCCDTQEPWIWLQHLHGRWEDHRCLSGTLVSEQSVAHTRPGTPWHMHRNFWFPRASCRTWIGFGACTFLHIVSSCHEVIPGGTKATIVGVDEDGDLPVFTDDGKMMATWCSIWLQVWERQCRPLIPTSPTLQRQKSDDQTTLNNSCAKSSNVLLQTRWLLCRSTMEH